MLVNKTGSTLNRSHAELGLRGKTDQVPAQTHKLTVVHKEELPVAADHRRFLLRPRQDIIEGPRWTIKVGDQDASPCAQTPPAEPHHRHVAPRELFDGE